MIYMEKDGCNVKSNSNIYQDKTKYLYIKISTLNNDDYYIIKKKKITSQITFIKRTNKSSIQD